MSVKIKIQAGGIANNKLNAMEDARSVIPTVLTWLKKNFITSNNGMPLKPGSLVALLFFIR